MRRLGPVLVLLIAIAAPPARAADPVHLGSLGPDESLFWQDGYVGDHPLHSIPAARPVEQADTCELHGACTTFTLDLTGTGEALRVAYDTPMRDDNFLFTVTDPEGNVTTATNPNNYSIEVLLPDPVPGRWTLQLDPYSAEDAPFRLRAKLESVHHRPGPDEAGYLLPNLRVMRMWEFGFTAPANPLNGLFPPDDINPPLEAAGVAPLSCAADETVDGAERCLRYSFGLGNAGDGVFDVRWTGDRVSTERHKMTQCVQRGDGTVEARPAGTGSFHQTHGHWHYDDVVHHELFRVLPGGALESTGNGKKIGYSPADQGIVEWDRFVQARPGTSGQAGNCAPDSNQRLGMSAGWGDAYRYQRPGNYVEFSAAGGDGEYVVQTVADPLGHVLESDETDNTAYAHIVVDGDEVTVEETGIGLSPWDPDKRVIEDWWTA